MNYKLRFIPEIEDDLITGYKWYETNSKGLGEEFLRIFYANVSEIYRNPLIFPEVHQEYRRRLMRRFPYAIYFRILNDQIIILGLFHCARNPVDIKIKLRSRN